MNYIVMVGDVAVAFCQEEAQAKALKPDLPGAAIYRAASLLDEINGNKVVVLYDREYCRVD